MYSLLYLGARRNEQRAVFQISNFTIASIAERYIVQYTDKKKIKFSSYIRKFIMGAVSKS